jgi:hypothetical protein
MTLTQTHLMFLSSKYAIRFITAISVQKIILSLVNRNISLTPRSGSLLTDLFLRLSTSTPISIMSIKKGIPTVRRKPIYSTVGEKKSTSG